MQLKTVLEPSKILKHIFGLFWEAGRDNTGHCWKEGILQTETQFLRMAWQFGKVLSVMV